VGPVRGQLVNRRCRIGRLIVHPDFQGRGICSRLMAEMEALSPESDRFELFTGHKSAGTLRLYERLGYRECRREQKHRECPHQIAT
jgi:ribosomal protein S18 acetylase RimI-like enzyme